MDKLGMLVYLKVMLVKESLENFMEDERGAVDIVAIVVMIGIAVLLAVLFRTQIESLLNTLFGTIEENATSAIN